MQLDCTETIITDSEDSFMEVRHLILKGTNREMGSYLASYAQNNLGFKLQKANDSLLVRSNNRFASINWPGHFERTKGVADFFGFDYKEQYDFSSLSYDVPAPACSCVFYPGSIMQDGHSRLSRNYDFTLGPLADALNLSGIEDETIATSRPFLMELYPEQGYPSLFMCAYDLLSSAIDGINSEGLSVALLAVDEGHQGSTMEPRMHKGAGLDETQLPRYLLETCATAEEARLALLTVNQYYQYAPCHYIIADSHGDGFVWEMSPGRNIPHIINADGKPLPVTNHFLHQQIYSDTEAMKWSLYRMDAINSWLEEHNHSISEQQSRELCASIHPVKPAYQGQFTSAAHPTRSLWTAIYDMSERSVEIDFYLGEEEGEIGEGIRRSKPLKVALSC